MSECFLQYNVMLYNCTVKLNYSVMCKGIVVCDNETCKDIAFL